MKREEQLKIIHLLLKETGLEGQKETIVGSFTEGRSTSSKDLDDVERAALVKFLQDSHDAQCKRMRGKVAHYLSLLGYVNENEKPDWRRIDAFIQNIGSNNPRKAKLYHLYQSELPKIVSQVEQMYKAETKRLGQAQGK